MYISLDVKYLLFLPYFNKICFFFGEIFEIYLHIKFHENPSRGSRVFACGQTDRQTYMKKLIVAFLIFAKAP